MNTENGNKENINSVQNNAGNEKKENEQKIENSEHKNGSYLEIPVETENDIPIETSIVEVSFKGNRRELYKNDKIAGLKQTDLVIVEVENGIDAGILSNCCVNTINKIKNLPEEEMPKYSVLRKATQEDKKRCQKNADEAVGVVEKARELVNKHNLDMKITEAEWQFDRQRLTIYFTAPQRVDFRNLVKDLAKMFKTRIELRQISSREETRRLGCGIGPCGKELCCTTFINEFSQVTLDHARMQQLSNNVAKLSGNCGRLKCCLLFEYQTYVEAFEKYPPLNALIETEHGTAKINKVDIFKDKTHLMLLNSGKGMTLDYNQLKRYIDKGLITVPENNGNNGNGQNGYNNHHS